MAGGPTILDLSAAIMAELEEYTEETNAKVQKVVDEVTKEAYLDLSNNPVIPKRSGEYAKKFYIRKEKIGFGKTVNIIANKKYQITHLLERPHPMPQGGMSKAYPHWAEAQKIADTLPERMKEALER